RVVERLVRGVPRGVRPADRRPAVRAGPFGASGGGPCGLRPRGRRLCLAAMADLKPVYLLTGGDRPKIARAVERLRGRFAPEAVESLSAAECGGGDVVAACNALGLFAGGGRLVLV